MKTIVTPYGIIYRDGEREWFAGSKAMYEAAKAWEVYHPEVNATVSSTVPVVDCDAATTTFEESVRELVKEDGVLVAASELKYLRELMLTSGNEAVRSAGELLLPRLALLLDGKAKPHKNTRDDLAGLAAEGRAMIEELKMDALMGLDQGRAQGKKEGS